MHGTLVAADDDAATVRVDGPTAPSTRRSPYAQIDRARTVFEWPATAKGTNGRAAGARPHPRTVTKKEHAS